MAVVDLNHITLDEALQQYGDSLPPTPLLIPNLSAQRRRVFRSVFPTDFSQPTPNATPVVEFLNQGEAFGHPSVSASTAPFQSQESEDLDLPDAPPDSDDEVRPQPQGPAAAADDQVRYDRAWHVVTARIALPSSVAVDDSFGTLASESQLLSSQDAATEAAFQEALRLVLQARSVLPRAAQTESLLDWHTHQIRRHYAQHVRPLLSACADETTDEKASNGAAGAHLGSPDRPSAYYNHHMTVVLNCVHTLEAAFRLYFYGLMLIVRGLPPAASDNRSRQRLPTADDAIAQCRRDVHALVARSTPPGLVFSIRVVFTQFANILLGIDALGPPKKTPKVPMAPAQRPHLQVDMGNVQAMRRSMHELLSSLSKVGLAGDNFQVLLAEIMDRKMVEFIRLSFAGRWADPMANDDTDRSSTQAAGPPQLRLSRSHGGAPSANIAVLHDWIENSFARLAHEVLAIIGHSEGRGQGQGPEMVSFADVRKWKDVGLDRLSSLRMAELFDIVLHWPLSRGGLEDLRVSVTTPQRRAHLVSAFTNAMRLRLLHPACSTLEILQTYVAMIRTFHVLDPSNVLLSAVVGPLQLYLCQREDAVRIVVEGLLADPEEAMEAEQSGATVAERIAQSRSNNASSTASTVTTEGPGGKLVELATILNDPSQQRRRHIDEEELDWNDMEWVPDPIDAGTNYRRPKSEDVIGTLISALGSPEAFTNEFQSIVAERLLSAQVVFSKEVKVLNLLKKRFGEAALQSCEVMIRDIQDSNRLDAIIRQVLKQQDAAQAWRHHQHTDQLDPMRFHEAYFEVQPLLPEPVPVAPKRNATGHVLEYQAKVLSRLYWPGLVHDRFVLPPPVATLQERFDAGYEFCKKRRKLAWLNQLGQARVELELADRTVVVNCKTYEAVVIYAFQAPGAGEGGTGGVHELRIEALANPPLPARRTVSGLVRTLKMDEGLVLMALAFWQKQGVLRHDTSTAKGGPASETYVVVETLASAEEAEEEKRKGKAQGNEDDHDHSMVEDEEEGGGNGAVETTAPATTTLRSRQAQADEAQRTVYWQFIVGMLTNSAASMPLAQIAMMLKMLVAGGFSWSDEELQEFLGEKTAEGELEVSGGKYRLVKK